MTPEQMRIFDPCRADLASRLHGLMSAMVVTGAPLSLPISAIYRLLEKPPEAALGDYAFPCFRFAKELGCKPPDIAAKLAEKLAIADDASWVREAKVVGAFLNIFIKQEKLAGACLSAIADGSYFRRFQEHAEHAKTRVMIEYSQPNTHKEFHVGHGRNICLGNSVVRLYRYLGYDVISANYPGDEGTHIAKVLWYLRRERLTPPVADRGAWLGRVYVAANRTLAEAQEEEKATYEREVSDILRAIESKQGEVYDLWRETRQWSLEDFYRIYEYMDVDFDQYFFESEVSADSQLIVDEFLNKGVFKEDQGAIGVDLKDYKLGFMIVRKSDGNTLYATKDLVLARRKFADYHIDRSIYVVADEQNFHFRQVFKTLELMGFEQAKQCYHLSYGMVTLPEGKMSSRSGNSVTFMDLVRAVEVELDKILSKYAETWTAEERLRTRHQLTVGAIKYGMLNTDPVKNIVFQFDEWLSFEGNSGPYLMYSYARTQSILRKATDEGMQMAAADAAVLQNAEEFELLRYLYDFNSVVEAAAENYRPSLLTHYLFETCKAFNRFYGNLSVLKADTEAERSARLALVNAFGSVLKRGLHLIGITPPERM